MQTGNNSLFVSQKFFANCSKFLKSDLKNGAVIMRHSFFLAIACALTLSACGTAQGVMNGVGAVLDGMGNDARSIGSIFN